MSSISLVIAEGKAEVAALTIVLLPILYGSPIAEFKRTESDTGID